jgi:hypothetical protein
MMNRDDMVRLGIVHEAEIALTTAVEDGVQRRVSKLKTLEYDPARDLRCVPPGIQTAHSATASYR